MADGTPYVAAWRRIRRTRSGRARALNERLAEAVRGPVRALRRPSISTDESVSRGYYSGEIPVRILHKCR
ncbi:hypothetical protein TPA0910_51740 [Streptomyces hygroscopicus subsp. sporocinereus]|uniref:Transposase n=1 Tax=Streptomyces hygroscopicus TaxID=1912 RepID=A0ABQ3U672_STRHY|nr:hypothetical protein TPA0910_51740 [Streptomyces hygroscopicus]